MAKAKKAKSVKKFESKGDKVCYTSAAVANRVAGGLKARGKRASVTGRCVTLN